MIRSLVYLSSGRATSRPTIRHARPKARLMPAWVVLATLVAVSSTSAVGEVETPRVGEHGVATATSNQPVAVDGGSVEDNRTKLVVDANDSKSATSSAATADRTVGRTVISRSGRADRTRANTRRMADSLVARDDSPWYRTGFGSLAIVLLLVGSVAWAARRWLPGSRMREDGMLRVVARASLTPKSNVALLRLGRRFVLLGVSGERVSMLSEITDPEEVSELALRVGSTPTISRSVFDRTLDAESMDYQHAEPKASADVAPPARRRVRKSASLQDLLAKIRTLQTGPRT